VAGRADVRSSGLPLSGVISQLIVEKDNRIFPFLLKDLSDCYEYYYNFRSRNGVDCVA